MRYVFCLMLMLVATSPVAYADEFILKQMEVEIKVRRIARAVAREAFEKSNEAIIRTSIWKELVSLIGTVDERCLPENIDLSGHDARGVSRRTLFIGGCMGRRRSPVTAFKAYGIWSEAIELRDRYVLLEYERVMTKRLASLKNLPDTPRKLMKRFFKNLID